jgi:hypothetical protein
MKSQVPKEKEIENVLLKVVLILNAFSSNGGPMIAQQRHSDLLCRLKSPISGIVAALSIF